MKKSLLRLLKEEDKTIREYESYQEDYEHFSKIEGFECISWEYGKRAQFAKSEIDSVRKEICEYFKLIGIAGKEIMEDEKRKG